MLRCKGQDNCVNVDQRCDGEVQCPAGDDEWLCDVICPAECHCNGLTYSCVNRNMSQLPGEINMDIRKLFFSENRLILTNSSLDNYSYLLHLDISKNEIISIPRFAFKNLGNLYLLNISYNNIKKLEQGIFIGLHNLLTLDLHGNHLMEIKPNGFDGLNKLPSLDLNDMDLDILYGDTFIGLNSLTQLDISGNGIATLQENVFNGLPDLQGLMMSRNKIEFFSKSDFQDLSSLQFLEGDDYMFCCFVTLQLDKCQPQANVFSSCDDLMSNNVQRSFLWILGMVALLGNGFVLLWRGITEKSFTVTSFLIMQLAISDFAMGVYMIIIAGVDLYYRGRYIENSKLWTYSPLCQILGCLSTFSSEASVFILCVITGDRIKNIVFPFNGPPLTIQKAGHVMICVWGFAILLGVIPLLPLEYFAGEFYARSPVCVSLHITQETPPGWQYSVFVFHGLNLCSFIFIFLAYSYMYSIIKASGAELGNDQKQREMAAARKMTIIVLTDFCCWVPINIMGKFNPWAAMHELS